LVRTDLNPNLQIDYDIVFSPTYQVPVLYFTLRWHNRQGPLGLDAVYQYVVPDQYRKELKGVGIMGGISFGVGVPPSMKIALQELIFRSTIQNLALRPFLSTRATRRMP